MTESEQGYSASMSYMQDAAEELTFTLARWAERDRTGSEPEPEARQSANAAMAQIDEMLAKLHWLRAQLVTEIRKQDDAFENHRNRHWNREPATGTGSRNQGTGNDA
jgi:hypothetical protein